MGNEMHSVPLSLVIYSLFCLNLSQSGHDITGNCSI